MNRYIIDVDVPGTECVQIHLREATTGRMIIAGVYIAAPDGVTSDMLRSVPLAVIENRENMIGAAATVDQLPPLTRPQRGHDGRGHSEPVARHYQAWASFAPNPVAEMAKASGFPHPTVQSWVHDARLRGILPPARAKRIR